MKVDELVDVASAVSNALDGDDVSREDIIQMINGVLPEVIWNDRVTMYKNQGWTLGEEENEKDKVSPDLVLYSSLAPEVHAAAEAVYAVVKSLLPYITSDNPGDPVVPPGLQGTMTEKQQAAWEEENDVQLPTTKVEKTSDPAPKKSQPDPVLVK